jgi:hypothetical protein
MVAMTLPSQPRAEPADAGDAAARLGGAQPPEGQIAAELRKREAAVRFANASIGLEGLKVSAEAQARADRFIAGEIDLAEFLNP